MDAGVSPARQARTEYRHELRTLTYVTLGEGNGGIVRNLTHNGIGVQAMAAVRAGQQLRVRFDLRHPRLQIVARGEVIWSTRSGLCGIRFLDAANIARQIDEWIFGNLLDRMSPQSSETAANRIGSATLQSISGQFVLVDSPTERMSMARGEVEVDDGLVISPAPLKVIELPTRPESPDLTDENSGAVEENCAPSVELDGLPQPVLARGLPWLVNALVMIAALLLFAFVFLSVTGEIPKWPAAMSTGAVLAVAALYWGFFKLFGDESPGARLVRLARSGAETGEEERDARFR